MKNLICKYQNYHTEVVGKITFKHHLFKCNDFIFVSPKPITTSRYAAVITDDLSKVKSTSVICICEHNKLNEFNEGDIVVLGKNGVITFVYEINAAQNVIMITEKCNHKCIMCPQPPVNKEESKLSFNLRLISLMDKKNKREIGLSGGEPTAIGDDLITIMKAIKKQCPNAPVTMLTNGVMLSNFKYAYKIASCGIRDLQVDIPLYSDIPSIHNYIVGAQTFYKSVQALYNLAQLGVRIGIRIVVMKNNYNRLVKLADYIYHNFPFVSQIAFMQMEFHGNANVNFKDLWVDPYDYKNELKEAVLLLNDRDMSPMIYNSQLCVLPKEIREFAIQSISGWKDIYIPECEGCIAKGKCAGFFESNKQHHSSKIIKFTTEF